MKPNKPLPSDLVAARPALADDPTAQHPANGRSLPPPPAKYTLGLHEQIIENIRNYNRPVAAAQMAGITANTFYDWMKRGKEGDPHLARFVDDVELAIGQAEGYALKVVTNSFVDDPENAKWYLERTRGAGYDKASNAKVEAILTEVVQRLRDGLTDAEYRKVLALISGQTLPEMDGPGRFQLAPAKIVDADDDE